MGRARGSARADDYGHLKNHVYFQVCAVTSCNPLFALNFFFYRPSVIPSLKANLAYSPHNK